MSGEMVPSTRKRLKMFRDFTDIVVLHIKKGCKGMKNRRHFFLIPPCIFHCLTVKTDKCVVGSLISNQNDSLAVYGNK
jgi:hypothetical protein